VPALGKGRQPAVDRALVHAERRCHVCHRLAAPDGSHRLHAHGLQGLMVELAPVGIAFAFHATILSQHGFTFERLSMSFTTAAMRRWRGC